jgi:hypothetical protein
MIEDRYLPLDLANVAECQLFMLPGIDSRLNSFKIGNLRITRLAFKDWIMIEKNQFIDDLQSVYVAENEPLFCVFGGGDPQASDEVQRARSAERESLVKRLILALRLCRPEPVADGTMSIVYRRVQNTNIREPRVFGRNAYNRRITTLLEPEQIRQLNIIYDLLDIFESYRSAGAITVAIELFQNASAEIVMEHRDRLVLLLGALEALTGGKLQPLQAIPFANTTLKRFLKDYRTKRNEIAHGGETGREEDVVALRKIVQLLLCESITIELLFPTENLSSGLPLLEGMRNQTKFGIERLIEARVNYRRGIR